MPDDKLAKKIERVRAYDCGDWPAEDSIALRAVCDAAARADQAERERDHAQQSHADVCRVLGDENRALQRELEAARAVVEAARQTCFCGSRSHRIRDKITAYNATKGAPDADR